MTVKDLVEQLQGYDQEAEIQVITVKSNGYWDRTSEPKITEHENMFGKRVFIE